MNLYPLKLSPQPSERLWGGERLKTFVADFATLNTAEPIGEAWLIYAENQISNGPLAGQTLQHAADTMQASLLGSTSVARYGTKVPLLAKLIDADAKLSVQVHPDDAYAAKHEAESEHLGKTEAWYILDAQPDAAIVWDFEREVSKDEVRKAAEEGELESLLRHVPVRQGDVIYNEAGRVHAIGAGVFLYEIQQSSDLTYRLYDYKRRGADGELRELHLDKALDVMMNEPQKNAKLAPKQLSEDTWLLVASDYFVMERWDIAGTRLHTPSPESLDTLSVLEGSLTLTHGGEMLELHKAESVVLPALLGECQLSGEARVIRCFVPS